MNLRKSYEKRILKLRSWLFDPENLTLTEERLGNTTRRDIERPLYEDRLQELMDYYRMTADEIHATQNKESIEKYKYIFDTSTDNDSILLESYRQNRLVSNTRHMLAYTRFGPASKLLWYINSKCPPSQRKRFRILDYGCGVSDYGLAFALRGYPVTIADIEGGNLDFARWRYHQRNLRVEVIAIQEKALYPDLGLQNLIIAGEVLEHIRDPVRVLRNMYKALPVGGFLWYSGYPEYARNVGGCHLIEAATARPEALDFVKTHFKSATQLQLPGCLHRKC